MTEILPLLPVPVVLATQWAPSMAHYRDVLGFDVVQEIPHTLAVLHSAGVTLQLWQQLQPPPSRICRVQLEAGRSSIFALHSRMVRRGHTPTAYPSLKPWGAWEFCVKDGDGNLLVFVQWVLRRTGSPQASARRSA